MRVSSFSRGSVVAISLFAVFFLAAMYQVGNSLTNSQQQNSNYQQLKSLTNVQLYRTVASYLQSGDAGLLNQAQSQLSAMVESAEKIEMTSLANNIKSSATTLQTEIENKFRAMGKLSGDPLALLRNSEQSISAINTSLANYATETTILVGNQQTAYLKQTTLIAASLAQLTNAREKYFNNNLQDTNIIKVPLNELIFNTKALNNFPLLEVFAEIDEDEDDFFADEDDREDLSEEAINELISLTTRYQLELNNTLQIQLERQQGLALLSDRVTTLENTILSGEQTLAEQHQVLKQQIIWVVSGLLFCLIIFLATNYWLMRTVILKPLRKLRDSFVILVEEGRVENIIGISEKTELGEISTSFNKMVNKLAKEDKEKANQLNLVSNAMQTMEAQTKNILNSSSSTSEHLVTVDDIMASLTHVTDNVNTLSQQVVENAQATQTAMNSSQYKVGEVLQASETTNQAANAGKQAILSLTQSVESVGSIVDVISSIADQTNLLALNAAIEAARAGEHGRGFSVVADEVRQLAGKTQESLDQVSKRLEQLNQASNALADNIYGIEQASSQQKSIAEVLRDNAENVVKQAITSASVAEDTLGQINQQRTHFADFAQAMQSVNSEVLQSRELAQNISQDVANQMNDIHQTLKLVS